jgi:SAM-dependent methyltransferase
MNLRSLARQPYRIASAVTGIDVRRTFTAVRHVGRFLRDLRQYSGHSRPPFTAHATSLYPILTDFESEAGAASGHYFHQDLWAARKVYARRPARHLDVGSRVDGFVSHLLVFMDVQVVDIRPLTSDVRGLSFVQDDGARLDGIADGSVDSLSSLHAVEHFGLGRYGDPVDPDACFQAMESLARVLAPAGRLYFSVPIGRERVEFNAHRVFAPSTVLRSMPGLELVSFSAVDDAGRFHADCDLEAFARAELACGLYELTK